MIQKEISKIDGGIGENADGIEEQRLNSSLPWGRIMYFKIIKSLL